MIIQDENHIGINNLLYSCTNKVYRGAEHFVHEHSLGYIIAGEVNYITPNGTKMLKAGTMGIIRRNQLVKSTKIPPPGGEFRSINIHLTQEALRRYSAENHVYASERYSGNPLLQLQPDVLLKGYFESLMPYFERPAGMTAAMTALKTYEAIELLLQADPDCREFLFDFTEPYKIDLEAFMNQHYMYNVPMGNFAKLTGRSLASFKRDFEKIFNTSPGQWLQQKRLNEAHYLIKEKGLKPSSVYLDVGFENLSHFSFAFKKAFGVSPSLVS